jgi:excisionase family DNA binding protein
MGMVTVGELARRENIPESTIRAWVKGGKLKAIRPGTRIYIDPEDWQEFKRQTRVAIQTDKDVRAVLQSLFGKRRTA